MTNDDKTTNVRMTDLSTAVRKDVQEAFVEILSDLCSKILEDTKVPKQSKNGEVNWRSWEECLKCEAHSSNGRGKKDEF